MTRPGADLPPRLRQLVDRVVERAGLPPSDAARVRDDLERHFLDGLAHGLDASELADRFGDPDVAATSLATALRAHTGAARPARLEAVVADARYALRVVRRHPAFAAAVVLVFALGIAVNTVTLSVLNALLLRPLPIEDPGAVVDVWAQIPGGNSFLGFSIQDFLTFRERTGTLDGLAAFAGQRLRLGEEPNAETVTATFVSDGYFDLLGLDPALGSLDLPGFDDPGAALVAVVSHTFWRTRLAGDPDVVGSTLRLEGRPTTVIGVAPAGFGGTFIGFPSHLWSSLATASNLRPGFDRDARDEQALEMIGRARPGLEPEAVEAELDRIAEDIERAFPETNRGHRVGVSRATGIDHSMQAGVRLFATAIASLGGFVLVLVCFNIGGVLLARAITRDRELSVRLAVGAGRARLTQMLLMEVLVLVALGAAAALAIAIPLTDVLGRYVSTLPGGLAFDLSIDARVAALSGVAAFLAATVAALAPAAHAAARSPAAALRGRSATGRRSVRARGVLVAGQVATSVLLLVVTGFFVRALQAGLTIDPGFEAERVASFTLSLDVERWNADDGSEAQGALVTELAGLPDVEAVALADTPPIGVARRPHDVQVPGATPADGAPAFSIDVHTAARGWASAVGVPLIAGRDLTADDEEAGAAAALVNRAFVSRFWPGEEALGRAITVDGVAHGVVGVIDDTRFILQDESPDPLVVRSIADRWLPDVTVVVRARRDPLSVANAVDRAVRRLDPMHRPVQLRTARATLDSSLLPQRVAVVIVGAMGALALVLAAIGLYGLVQFTVTRDLHEIGVRIAMGGSRADVWRLVLWRGGRVVFVGLSVGAFFAVLALRPLRPFLSDVPAGDPVTWTVVLGLFSIVTLAALAAPARRATRVAPSEVLRLE